MEAKFTKSLMALGLLAGLMFGVGIPGGGVALAAAGVATVWLFRSNGEEHA
ncbi:hypothetical protein [Azoarcus olearius]|uniref:Hypothetical secreted protein n=1 Tax=Azoarcus sp. (strain BH72) TaxID=418699 RepID=A1K8Z8_AZOSB|nr:hypothetical protein [Azoarcus olearius]ANQ85850.1 hypothetical protein dqs_2822 [Azoarcus olearius]CAL95303.1 hypothetical secreted protein [Azoarcus olearius]